MSRLALCFLAATLAVRAATPAEPLSPDFHVQVNQADVPVYLARVMATTTEQRLTQGFPNRLDETQFTSFASFKLRGSAQITVTCPQEITSAKLLPASRNITPQISGHTVTFAVDKPGALVLEVNGEWVRSLQLFADPARLDLPNLTDPNVIYFGPGRHDVQTVPVGSNKTVYLAEGAIIYGHPEGPNPTAPIFSLTGSHITLRGHGIIDGSLCSRGTRTLLYAQGDDIRVDGITFRDSSSWSLCFRRCDHLALDNVKIFGWRNNSDGIDLCNCRDVEVSNCYARTFDDLIVLKTDKGQGESRNVTVHHCVLWNEYAHALSLGAELREPLSGITFSDCDIIHDKGRETLLRVYNCDSAHVRHVLFDHIRIEEAQHLISLWIGQTQWSNEHERGHIEDITFSNITSPVPARRDPWIDLFGFDANHAIDGVNLQHIIVGGRPLRSTDVHQNKFVRNLTIVP